MMHYIMISIIITSYKEPDTISRAIEAFLQQEIKEKFEIIVSAPDKETLDAAKKYAKNKKVRLFKDPGRGKTLALNLLLPKIKGRIIILTDGDVFVSENAVLNILKEFENESIGCVSGRPASINNRNDVFGYWSHLLCYAAHRMRLKRKNEFLECSGYLWAFRNKIIKKIPRETAEDSVVPALFYLEGFKIGYSEDAKVYVKFPSNFKEFISQKKRTAKGHETLGRYVDLKKIPRMKTFENEILESYYVFSFPRNLKEFFWTLLLFPFRLYIWFLVFFKLYVRKDEKVDGWSQLKTTK